MNDLQGSDSGAAALDTSKLLIYIMLSSLMKVHMQYFSPEAMQAIAENEKELLKSLRELDEDVNINDLVISLFQKEKLH